MKNKILQFTLYFMILMIATIYPTYTYADSLQSNSTQKNQKPKTTWDLSFYNNSTLSGNPINTSKLTTSSAPISFTAPNGNDLNDSIKSIRSTTSTVIQARQYKLSIKFTGQFKFYFDNKLIANDESTTSLKTIQKSLQVNDTTNSSSDLHTIRIEQLNANQSSTFSFTLTPVLSKVNLNDENISYNWGYYSPLGYPSDKFTLPFRYTSFLLEGDYFASLYADDDAQIFFDDKLILTKKPTETKIFKTAVIENVKQGDHTIKTNYTDSRGGEAFIYSSVIPFSNWVAYYYNNPSLLGHPVTQEIYYGPENSVLIRANNEYVSPVPTKILTSNYSVKYVTYKRLPAGKYELVYKAGDGIGIWLDNKQIINNWKDGQKALKKVEVNITSNQANDIHQITVTANKTKNPENLLVSIRPVKKIASSNIKTVVIDPGHGGSDTGAIGVGGLREKNVVLDVGKRVETLFKDLTPYKVYLTRSTDIFIPLAQRPSFAINKKANAFVSIHANAASPSASGLETYYYGIKSSSSSLNKNAAPPGTVHNSFLNNGSNSSVLASKTNPYIDDSKLLAKCIQEQMVSAFELQDRGAKHGNFQVIRANRLPAVLTEIGFITNKNDAEKLASPYWRQIAAEAIYTGILDYFELKGADVSMYRLQ
ncbi:N-acetylmuramoyl-L-alanine amidase [Gottfriedia luciferensis]|uniref:N-acetylmuramoyl-L-alanine amidase n=1 Tax=Gottfriedia luciferensis TaxID=178774 RepID=UPI001154FE1E|nr:N-acetylmuramoyl-L-alanine amidase [Gottfriedia luciferensis]